MHFAYTARRCDRRPMALSVRLIILGISLGLAHRSFSPSAEAAGPRVVAHRGLLQHAPENTLANFRACLELRMGFEFDVQRTRDGVLVCLHDDTVDRTTNGTGAVAALTLKELQALDAGSWFDPRFAGEQIPTVQEVLQLVAAYRQQDVLVAVDLKAAAVEQEVVQLARQLDVLPRLLFIGTTISDSAVRRQLRGASAEVQAAAVANTPDEFRTAVADADASWVYLRFIPTAQQIMVVHQAGKRAFIAGPTVSGHIPDNWQQAAEAGCDGILTDYPLELQTMLRAARRQ